MVWRRWHDGKFFSTGETVKEAHSQPQAHRTSFISSSLTLFRAAEPSLTVKLLADRHEINPPDLCSNIPHFYKGNYQKAWDSTRQHTGWHVIKSAAVLMSCSATQLQHKCAATKSSYGLQNVAWERERMNWSCNFFLSFWIKVQWKIRDLAINEQGLSFSFFFSCFSFFMLRGEFCKKKKERDGHKSIRHSWCPLVHVHMGHRNDPPMLKPGRFISSRRHFYWHLSQKTAKLWHSVQSWVLPTVQTDN